MKIMGDPGCFFEKTIAKPLTICYHMSVVKEFKQSGSCPLSFLCMDFGGRMNQKNSEKKGGIAERVEELLLPVADQLGLEIWDVEFAKRGPDNYLTVTIDSDDGITIEDCERMHRAIDPVLDEADPIEKAYMLEVSSPGIERDLTKDAHYEWAIGEQVELKLFAPVNGSRTMRGTLVSFDGNTVTLNCGNTEISAERKNVSKAKTIFEFTN